MKDFLETLIMTGKFNYDSMEERILKIYAMGKLTTEEMENLLDLASEHADNAEQVNLYEKVVDLEHRVYALETADYVVWTHGYTTRKGETVKYDYDNDGTLDLLRYDGGNQQTALKPGGVSGWHVVDSQGNILGTFYKGEFTPANE
ncbi:MAG: hypothetical protein IKE25_06200 [Clostridia bacterium]|nr:hypothetical protein [Clostridia bacterium]